MCKLPYKTNKTMACVHYCHIRITLKKKKKKKKGGFLGLEGTLCSMTSRRCAGWNVHLDPTCCVSGVGANPNFDDYIFFLMIC